MKLYSATVFGWLTIIEASNAKEALSIAKGRARSASLLSTDVTPEHIHRATADEEAQYRAMGGVR